MFYEFEVAKTSNLDTIERTWRKGGLKPLTPQGAFPVNGAYAILRVSPVKLLITTTENIQLQFVVKG